MEKNVLETEEKVFSIEDLHQRKAEKEELEEKDRMITKMLEKIIDREEDENEIGE